MQESDLGLRLAERARLRPRAERGCPEAEALAALALAGLDELGTAERESLVAHLEICPDCAAELATAAQAGALVAEAGLASGPALAPMAPLAPTLPTAPGDRFRRDASIHGSLVTRPGAARRWLPLAAALVFVAGGLVVYRLRAPEEPVLRGVSASTWSVSPADGTNLALAPHELVWPGVPGARAYEVELFDAAFSRLARSGELAGARYELPGDLELRRGAVYFWRVTVRGSAAESAPRLFSFRLAP